MARSLPEDRADRGRLLDLAHLSRQTQGDRGLEREVLALFERQSTAMIERLRQATTATSWAEAAHTLRGSALGIGAFQVAEAAEAVEKDHLDRLSRKAVRDLARLEAHVRETNALIAKLLGKP